MDLNLVIILGVFIAGFSAIAFLFNQRLGKLSEKKEDSQSMVMLQNQINEISKTLDSKLGESSKLMQEQMQKQFGQSATIIRDVTERLTKLDETNRQVVDFADQLQQLQDILKNPKQRGVLGEYYLETLLKNVLPPDSYKMQYKFKNGEIVDAAVFVKDKIIPIDSKFSLENYNRLVEERNDVEKEKLEKLFIADLKNRVVETAKYIRPDENTMEFAFMFIPHEAIYYDLLVNKIGAVVGDTESIIQRAAGKHRVLIVSPTSFLAYLQTVLKALDMMQVQEETKKIITQMAQLHKHWAAYNQYHEKIGKNLATTVNMYNSSSGELKKIDKDMARITSGKNQLETLEIDKPNAE